METTSEKHVLQVMLEEAGHEPYSYSGRAMYGSKCLAVNSDVGLGSVVGDVFQAIGERDTERGECEALAEAFHGMRTDSMGRGIVIYFPDVPYVEETDEEVAS
jgi:hypothetical protein